MTEKQALTVDVFMSVAHSGLGDGTSNNDGTTNRDTTVAAVRCASDLMSDGNLDTRWVV